MSSLHLIGLYQGARNGARIVLRQELLTHSFWLQPDTKLQRNTHSHTMRGTKDNIMSCPQTNGSTFWGSLCIESLVVNPICQLVGLQGGLN